MRLLLCLTVACPVFAGEFAVLKNGFKIRAETHEIVGSIARLHTTAGTLDVPAAEIQGFELEEYVAPPPAAAAVPAAATSAAEAPVTPEKLVEEAAQRHGLRPEFVRSVAKAESAFKQQAVSPKGAIGVMQLMPGTAAELGADPRDTAQNVDAGARYLRQLLDKYKNHPDFVRLALAAYNAGPGAVDRYGNIPPYRETQAYVERVLRNYEKQLKN